MRFAYLLATDFELRKIIFTGINSSQIFILLVDLGVFIENVLQ